MADSFLSEIELRGRLALDFLLSSQNPDGGWSYRPKKAGQTEPTSLALLALKAANETAACEKGLAFLRRCRTATGGIGVSPGDTAGNWTSYAALLAFNALGADEDAKALTGWILDFRDQAYQLSVQDAEDIASRFHYDVLIPGWPWIANTVSWVEPTALFATALLHTGLDPNHNRIRHAVRLLIDRRIRTGGWNYGVPFDRTDSVAQPLSSAIALLALVTAGFDEAEPAVAQAAGYLAGIPAAELSAVALGWTILAFRGVKTMQSRIPGLAAELGRRQRADGSINGNALETALAVLALGDFRFRARGRTQLR